MPPIDDMMMLDGEAPDVGGIPADMLDASEFGMGEGMGAPEGQMDEGVQSVHQRLIANINNPNIAADLDESELSAIGQKVLREYELDLASRSDWEERSHAAMDLAMQVAKEKSSPWPGASNIVYPLMTTAAVEFQARAYPAIVQGRNVCKGVVVGPDNGIPMPPEMMQQLMQMQQMQQMGGMGGQMGQMPGMQGGLPMLPQPPMMGGPQGQMMGQPGPGMGEEPDMPGAEATGGPPDAQGGSPQQQQLWIVKPGAKQERATKIGDHMSWQLLDEMTEWEEETDKLLLILPIIGCVFRKSFYDRGLAQNASMLVLAQNLVINYTAKSMERAPRITEKLQLYPYEIEERVRQGLFLEHEYGPAQDADGDDDAPPEFLEQHRWLDLDEDGYPEPYIVTVHKQTGKVARIVARYDAEGVNVDRKSGEVVKIDPVHYYTKYDFLPNPEGGIYGVGFGQLLGPINKAVNTTLNMLFDSGHLQNAGGGFVARGLSMHSGSIRFKPGEYKTVNAPGQSVRDAIVPFAHPGPSPQLIALLTFLVEAGKGVAGVKDVLQGQGEQLAASMQPTTLLAMIEQGLQTFTAVFKRVHKSLKKEFDKLFRLNRIYLPFQARYQVGDEWRTVTKEDYARAGGVSPISDPNTVSDMQKMAKAQLLQGYQNDPLCDGVEIRKRVLTAAQIEGVDKIVHGQTPPNPQIIAATAELELKGREVEAKEASAKATQIKDISQAVLNLANADKANAEMPLEHTAQYIKLMELQLKALLAPAEGRGSPAQGAPAPMMPPPAPALPMGMPGPGF